MPNENQVTKIRFNFKTDGSLQVITNICLYCKGDIYVNQDYIECRFKKDEYKDHFLEEISDFLDDSILSVVE